MRVCRQLVHCMQAGQLKATSGFGIKVDWDWDRSEVPKGYTMPFAQALATSTDGIITRAALPKWLLSLTKRGRQSLCGYYELEVSHLNALYECPNSKF